jgi:hypothetical protein
MNKLPSVILSLVLVAAASADSLNCRYVGGCDLPGDAWNVALSGNYAYIADDTSGLRVVDVSNPPSPAEVGYFDTPWNARGVALYSSYAFVADGGDGLWMINVADPAHPVQAGFFDGTPGLMEDVAVVWPYAYVADNYLGLRIINVMNPDSLREVGRCPATLAWDVAVSGSYAYAARVSAGLSIIDVSNPQSPTEVGHYQTPGQAYGVAVSGNYAYVADQNAGLRIIDVTNPASPTEAGHYDTPGEAWGVWISGNYAYVADRNALRIVDVADPENPTEVGFHDTRGAAILGVACAGGYIYVAESGDGLQIYQYTGAGVEEGATHDVAPLTPLATLVRGVLWLGAGTVPQSRASDALGLSRAALLDATGRKVMNLCAGANDVRHLAPGVYFVRGAESGHNEPADPRFKVIVAE